MEHILAITLNPQIDADLERLLISGGFNPHVCRSIHESRNHLGKHDPDLIFLTIKNEKEAFNLVGEILERLPVIPLILVFDRADPENAEKTINCGAAAYLNFPVNAEKLEKIIQKSLLQAKTRRDWHLKESSHKTNLLLRQLSDLETLFENTHDLIFLLDHNQRLLFANRPVQELFIINSGSFSGKYYNEVFSHPRLLELIDSSQSDTSFWQELEIDHDLVFSVQAKQIVDVGQIFTLNDITQLKRVDRVKNEFVSAISHDLRSPLTAIMGYVELIERVGQINDIQKDFIQKIVSSVHNISNLIDDLLNLSQIEASYQPDREPVQINKLIHYATQAYSKQIMEKNLGIQLSLHPGEITIYGDSAQMRQLFENLLENSIKYTPKGGKILIKTTIQENQFIFQIIDSGIGIPKDEQPHIFEKFYRASNIDESIIGTGLGLAIVKSIAENHKARIWVDSDVNLGSTFTIVLPLRKNKPVNYLPSSFRNKVSVEEIS